MSPNETLFLESTNKIIKDDINNSRSDERIFLDNIFVLTSPCRFSLMHFSFVQFFIWDFPGQIDFFDPTFDCEMIFGDCGALVFVIDAQDDYIDALAKLNLTVKKAYKVNPKIKFEVFIHKVDGVSDDFKMESQRDIATVREKFI